MLPPNHALQRTRRGRRGCNRFVPCANQIAGGRNHVISGEAGLLAPRRLGQETWVLCQIAAIALRLALLEARRVEIVKTAA